MERPKAATAHFPKKRLRSLPFLTLATWLSSHSLIAASAFVLGSPGVVLDTATNLEWEQNASAQGFNLGLGGVGFYAAQAYANSLVLDSAGGPWRLPTAAELEVLYAHLAATGVCGRNIDCTGDRAPFSGIEGNYWSSVPGGPGANFLAVSFLSGGQGSVRVDSGLAVWAVRASILNSVPEPSTGLLVVAGLLLIVRAIIDPASERAPIEKTPLHSETP